MPAHWAPARRIEGTERYVLTRPAGSRYLEALGQRRSDYPIRTANLRKIAFICFDESFFLRHFLPVVKAARASGFEVFALLPSVPTGAAADLLHGVNIISIRARRSHRPILRLALDVFAIASALRRCRPDIVQAFALHSCVVSAFASLFAPVARKVLTITGLGLIDIDPRWPNRLLRPFVYSLLRVVDKSGSACFVFENVADSARLGFQKSQPQRKLTLMGAGVNPSAFAPQTMPALPPLKLAIVSRMIWSKGIDLAVEAVTRMIERGVAIELDLYGAPDLQNQRHFPVALLREWGNLPGIRWHGHVSDIPGVWRTHHVGLFPSRGGEGLPRAMLEAASCGRALIATNVPGCADFVRTGLEGIIVEPNSVEELERAIDTLVRQPNLLEQMGCAGRRRILGNSTEEIITARYRQLFGELSGGL
jgi:glycosyltransferase involved in cell wall biosynthesis